LEEVLQIAVVIYAHQRSMSEASGEKEKQVDPSSDYPKFANGVDLYFMGKA